MKRTIAMVFCLALILLFSGCKVSREKTSGDYRYYLYDNGQAELQGYSGSETELTLPAELDGHVLTGIDIDYRSEGCFDKLVSVVIPDGYTEVGDSDFEGCKQLASVKLPSTLNRIGYRAFADCISLREIELPQGLASLGRFAFSGSSLETVNLPNSFEWKESGIFDGNPFADCKQLRNMIVADDHPSLRWEDGILTNLDKTRLLLYPASRTDAAYTIPENIKDISAYAFAGASLHTVTLPHDLYELPGAVFQGCVELERITLPSGIISIGSSAFSCCTSLMAVEIPEGVRTIGSYAFSDCTSLETLKLPQSVTEIGTEAFNNCEKLKTLTLPAGLEDIGERCFINSNVVLSVYPGSFGEKYAEEYDVRYRVLAADTAEPTNAPATTPAAKPEKPTAMDLPKASPSTLNTAAAAPSASGEETQDWPVPGLGEKLYVGSGKISQAEQLEVGFILAADEKSIRNLTIIIHNLKLNVEQGEAKLKLNYHHFTQVYEGNIDFGDVISSDKLYDFKCGEAVVEGFRLSGDNASCMFSFVVKYSGDKDFAAMDIPLNTTMIRFARQ